MKRIGLLLFLLLQIELLSGQHDFSFIFLPDLHLQPDPSVLTGFKQLARQVNKLHPDFILTGGDMIYTAKNVNDRKAEVLFDLMDKELKMFKMPVCLTMGNHETVGIMQESGIDDTNPMWGKRMYEKRYTNRYYSFSYEGWKFIVLDGIKILEKEKNYTQGVDSLQIEWIKEELRTTDRLMPIIISIHTPLLNPHAITNSKEKLLSENSETILNLFKGYNLKIVLEGHTHLYMNLFFEGIHYISGGSTSYASGLNNFNDGFLVVHVKNNKEELQFVHTYRKPD
jgi:Icc protein